jgi:hypothetical protein
VGYSREVQEAYKLWLCLGGVGLAVAWQFLPRRAATGLLVLLTVASGLNYYRMRPELLTERIDTYDVIHYYLNAKYWDELGYHDLYPAMLWADLENGGPYFPGQGRTYMAQGAGSDEFRPIEEAFARGRVVKNESFTPERWEAFTHDALYLQRETDWLDEKTWRQMIQDHGYNAAPAWTAIARPLASAVPVQSLKLLGWIDVVMLGLALGAVAWAYDRRTALWCATFLFVTYSGRWPIIGDVFLRFDYLAALLVAMALLRKGEQLGRPAYYAVAGAVAGYSATLRLFPALWMLGPAAKGLLTLPEGVRRNLLVLAAGFLVAGAALEGFAAASLGPHVISDHLADMRQHTEARNLSSRRVGFALALPFRGDLLPKNISKETKALVGEQAGMRLVLAGALLLVLAVGMKRARDDEAFAFGFVPLFFLTTASYYYYVTRATLVVAHAAEPEKTRHTVGLAALFGIEAFCNWSETAHPEHRVFLVGWLAWLLTAYAVGMAVWMAWESQQPQSAPEKAS